MPVTANPNIGLLATEFGQRPDISARSFLVTVFGDSIVPAGGEIWLGDLIGLCEPFGFSERLVRTSMFRLSGEGWFETERIGRRSKYRLTNTGIGEFAEAEARIYSLRSDKWDGQWTLVFVDGGLPERSGRDEIREALGWRGYAPVSTGIMGLPREDVRGAERLLERAGVNEVVAVASATFEHLGPLVRGARVEEWFGLSEPASWYREFIGRYSWSSESLPADVDDQASFLLRSMMVHDLRRPRLADPDLPAELLPPDWPAQEAMAIAGAAYRRLASASHRWIETTTGLSSALPKRFTV